MAQHDEYLSPPILGQSPYKTVYIPAIPGNDTIRLFAGREVDRVPSLWRLARGMLAIVCDANAANRKMRYTFRGVRDYQVGIDEVTYGGYYNNQNITANQSAKIWLLETNTTADVTYNEVGQDNVGVERMIGLTHLLIGGDYILISVDNGVAGDLLTVSMTFEYLNFSKGVLIP